TNGLWGEFECKVDAKLRFVFPVKLREQIGDAFGEGLMVARDLNRNILKVYPMKNWNRINKHLSKLNRFIKKNDDIVRRITGGATAVEADSTGRILIPRSLADWAGLKNEIVVFGSNDVIEIWDKNSYQEFYKEDADIEKMAEEVFGSMNFGTDDDDE
ncbi:MAG: division/cell wall cluster transcriptional repressor MraZ, partial [Bacteroidota bacterium]